MYMAAYHATTHVRSIRTVDLATGATTEIGSTTRGSGGFAIISPPVSVEVTESPVETVPALNVLPRPSCGEVNISYRASAGATALVSVTDLSGRTVFRGDPAAVSNGVNTIVWNGQGLPGGVYIVKLSVEGQVPRTAPAVLIP